MFATITLLCPDAFTISTPSFNYLTPPDCSPGFQGQPLQLLFPTLPIGDQTARAPLTFFQPDFRTPYVHSYFVAATTQILRGWTLEVDGLGSIGHKLLTTDLVNRGGLNPNLGLISYRSNQGSSELQRSCRQGTPLLSIRPVSRGLYVEPHHR